MRFRILVIMIASVCLPFSSLNNAALITHNNYTLNTDTNIVTNTDGTEWLQWDVTEGMSIVSALGQHASEGWVLAGNEDMASLFTDFGFFSGTAEGSSYTSYTPYVDGTDNSEQDFFIQLFGYTEANTAAYYGLGIDAYIQSKALYGSDMNGDSQYNLADVSSDFTSSGNTVVARSAMFGASYLSGSIYSGVGVAMIRTSKVSAPPVVAIFALGLMGLGFRRLKKQFKIVSLSK
jgi:hypothetical protein